MKGERSVSLRVFPAERRNLISFVGDAAMEGNWIKVALKVKGTTHLTQLDVNQSVEEMLRAICDNYGLSYERGTLALKVQDFCKVVGTEYVTEENKRELKHGRQLKLSKSPTERAGTLIDKLHMSNESETSTKNLKRLAIASKDSVMLRELHRQNLLQHLRVYASVRNLSEGESYRMYKVVGQFLAKGYVKTLCEDEVNHLMDVIVCEKKMTREMLVLAFEILTLLRKRGKLHWPTEFLRRLTPYLRLYGESKLQEKSLHFINHLYLQANDPEEETTILNFMKSSVMITYINKYVIREGLSDGIKQELYLYQRIILRKYGKPPEGVDPREEKILENLEYVIWNIGLANQVRDLRRSTEKETEDRSEKAQQMLRNLRLSLTPAGRRRATSAPDAPGTECKPFRESDYENEFLLGKIQERGHLKPGLSLESVDGDLNEDDPESGADEEGIREKETEWNKCLLPVLARDNLYYFILNDYKGFERLLLIHNNQLKSMLRTSIGVSGLLCNIFEIREREPQRKKGTFVPLSFLYYDYIIERMFCITVKLYHRTREEMGVAVDSKEESVVMKMVEDQLRMALESEPLQFLELETRLQAFTVEEVMRRRERTVKEEVNRQLTKQPAFVELKELLTPKIINLIREKRIRFMEGGEHVQQFDGKGQKIPGKRWFIYLTKIHDKMVMEECIDDPCMARHKPWKTVNISTIREIESGRKSNFHKEVYYNLYNERDMFFRPGTKQQEPELEFPISVKLYNLVYVDFCAGSELTMDYWVDGLRFLIGEKMNTRRTDEELDYLTDIELMEHLACVEGMKIPEKAPPLPPPPPNYHFALH